MTATPPGDPAAASTRVLLADDQPLVRSGLRVLLTDTAGFEAVGEAGDGAQAVRLAGQLRPDVVMMDIRMPGMDGIEATRRITAADAAVRVLMLTTFDEDEHVYGALRAGASGFAVKDMPLDDLLAAIRVVAAGDALLAPSVTRRLIADFAARPARRRDPVGHRAAELITGREREVLTLIGLGHTNTEIATALHISVATAKSHVSRLITKLDARDRVHLVIMAYETGLVTPGG